MTLDDTEDSELENAIPARPQKRDALGQFCYVVHFLPLIYVVSGWLVPWRGALVFYLVFLPGMYLQWKLNKSSCVLNNIESLIRTGRWRDSSNREEGAWLRTLVNDRTGWNLSPRSMDAFINAMLVLFWGLGLSHLRAWL